MPIKACTAMQIFDSRGNPTIEVDITTEKGVFRASVPSGSSVGINEALELRDKDPNFCLGLGVTRAINNVHNIIAPAIVGKPTFEEANQQACDAILCGLDGTESKWRLGANAIMGVSMAICKAGAAKKGKPLYKHISELSNTRETVMPVPAFTVIHGGKYAGNRVPIQDIYIMPTGAKSFAEAMKMGSETYHHLRNAIQHRFGRDAISVGNEGGFAPNFQTSEEALQVVVGAIEKAGYTGLIQIGVDAAASNLFKKEKYDFDFKSPSANDSKSYTGLIQSAGAENVKLLFSLHQIPDQSETAKRSSKEYNIMELSDRELTDKYKTFISKYPVVSIEDPFEKDAWKSWTAFTSAVKVQVVADELVVTNPKRIKTAIDTKACNCLLLKINQIGTVSEAITAFKMARDANWSCMVSQRSGETEETFIADLAVGLSAGQIKAGAPCRSERVSKYNQLLYIEEEMLQGAGAKYAGIHFRNPRKLWSVGDSVV